jgi:hypothetical protein
MTAFAQTSSPPRLAPADPHVSDRTPHLFVVTVIGAVVVLGTIVRLQATPAAAHPLSGAPVDGPVAATVSLPDEPSAAIALSEASPGMLAAVSDDDPARLGPPGVTSGGLTFRLALPTDAPTAVTVTSEFLRLSGALTDAASITYPVIPDADGSAAVSADLGELLFRERPGIYRIAVTWEGVPLAETQLALGTSQPSGVAIFDKPRRLVIAAGTYTAVRFDADGGVGQELERQLGTRARAGALAFARFGGTGHVLVGSGPFAKYWLPLGEGIRLR